MARIRTIKPKFYDDMKIGLLKSVSNASTSWHGKPGRQRNGLISN